MENAAKLTEIKMEKYKSSEVFSFMACTLADSLEKEGMAPRMASNISINVMIRMECEFGGQQLYIPSGRYRKVSEKSEEIYDKYNSGYSVSELAKSYRHSTVHIYSVIASEKKKRKAEAAAK